MHKLKLIGLVLLLIAVSEIALADAGRGVVRFGEIMVKPANALLLDEVRQSNRQLAEAEVNRDNYALLVKRTLAIPLSQGYYYAVLTLQRIEPTTVDTIVYLNPVFNLDWGEQVRVETFIWEGLQKTDPHFLDRQVEFLTGRVFNPMLTNQLRRRLAVWSFVQIGDELRLVKTVAGKYGLVVPVRERHENQFMGVVGYVPARLNANGYFTGEMNLKMLNISGCGRSIELFWSKPDRYSQRLQLRGSLPTLFRRDILGTIEFQQTLRDTLVVIRDLILGGGSYFRNGIEWQGQLAYSTTVATPGGRRLLGLQDVTVFGLRNKLSLDRRDDIYAPRRGWYSNVLLGIGRRREAGKESWQYQTEIAAEFHFPLTARWSLASLNNYLGRFSNRALQYSDYHWFGGARSLRGYPEEFFGGTQIGWSTLELRWLLAGQSRVFLFYDQGYYQAMGKRGYPHAWGVGFRLESRLGLLGLDYGFGKGDSFSTAKLHLHIENWF